MAVQAYRHILRSARIAFQGDLPLFAAAREQARIGFEKGRELSPSSDEALEGVAHAEEVAEILRRNVVQGEKEAEESGRYKLRIHKDTERGDNDSIKIAGSGITTPGQCCSSR